MTLTFSDTGSGRPVLLLHGGGGPLTVAGFGALLAGNGFRVIVPSHPGFGGTARPTEVSTFPQVAELYSELLDDLDLADVTVIGNSVGGWIGSELALLASPRVTRLVLADAVGIDVAEHPVADFFSLTFPELARLSYHDPEAFQIDPTTMSSEQQAVMAGNRTALAVYAGTAMTDPTLRDRLTAIDIPTLVVWGSTDRIADPDYGRAYAAAIPGAEFALLPETGHLPQLESPRRLLNAVAEFIDRT